MLLGYSHFVFAASHLKCFKEFLHYFWGKTQIYQNYENVGFYFQRLWGEIQTFLFTLYLIKNRCYIKQFCFGDLFFLVNTLHPNSILSVHICGNIHFKITIFSHTRIFVCLVVVAVVAYSNFTFKRLKPVTFCV